MDEDAAPPADHADELAPPPWEPPVAGTEAEQLLAALDRQRATFRWKADALDAAGLAVRVGASRLTLGGLLRHLAAVEELVSAWRLSGGAPTWPTDPRTWFAADGWEATLDAAGAPPEELCALYDGAVARSRQRIAAALGRGGLDQLVHEEHGEGRRLSLRRLLLDLLEEYGRHTGHADLLREAVDGRTGEDPPPAWRPPAGLTER